MSIAPITVRYPEFDFSTTPVVWGPNAEAVIGLDAGSPLITPIEIFLLKVMRRAKAEMDPVADAELLRDMDLFMKQEGQHNKVHAEFNRVIREWCPPVAPIEQALVAEYDEFLATKPLRWLVGYCECFEALGGRTAVNWVDGWTPEHAGTFESSVVEMFRWHLAEEYEHRTVMFRVYERLYGEPADESHKFRVELLEYGLEHIGGWIDQFRQAMLAAYRDGMSPEEIQASVEREERAEIAMRERVGSLLATAWSPDYDPAENPPPEHLDEVLAQYSTTRG
jgi:predicted metal-dependent hydrolase